MSKILFNTRDELVAVNLDLVAAVVANGNYSRIIYITKREFIVTLGISKIETALKKQKGKTNKIIRLGRSLLINHRYLHKINTLSQTLILSDGINDIRINVSKNTLKAYKTATVKTIKINKNENNSIGNSGEPAV